MDLTDPTDRRRPGRRTLVGAAAATVVAGGVGWAVLRSHGSSSDGRPRPLALKEDAEALVGTGMVRLVGRRLYAGSDPLSEDLAAGEDLRANIAGSIVPLAVREDAVTDVVVYSAWRSLAPDVPVTATPGPEPVIVGRPSIRVWRGVGGPDDLIADGAYSPAVAPGGTIAYAKAVTTDLRTDGPYLARIVVGSLDSPYVTWWTSTPGRYVPVAWAGSNLVAYSIDKNDSTDVQVYSAPDAPRTLMRSATLIAVSPNGRRVAVAEQRGTVSIVDVASGTIADAVTLGGQGDSSTAVGVVRPGGAWRGSRIVASTARGLVVLDTVPALHVIAVYPYTDAMPGGISEPQFVDDDTVIGTAALPESASTAPPEMRAPTALVVCTLSTSSCARGSIGATTGAWRQWVTNWSR